MEKNENKNKNVIIAILVTIIIILVAVIIYFMFIKKEDKGPDNISKNNQLSEVKYEYQGEGDFKKLKTLSINGVDISKYIGDTHNDLKIDKQNDFVIISYSSGGTCGFEKYGLLLFDYNAKLLYQSKKYNNEIDTLVYDGEYKYDSSNGVLTIGYHLSCDLDCNACNKLLYEDANRANAASCSTINKYRDVDSKVKYSVKYLGNGQFDGEKIVENTKIINDEYYSYLFKNCSKDSNGKNNNTTGLKDADGNDISIDYDIMEKDLLDKVKNDKIKITIKKCESCDAKCTTKELSINSIKEIINKLKSAKKVEYFEINDGACGLYTYSVGNDLILFESDSYQNYAFIVSAYGNGYVFTYSESVLNFLNNLK